MKTTKITLTALKAANKAELAAIAADNNVGLADCKTKDQMVVAIVAALGITRDETKVRGKKSAVAAVVEAVVEEVVRPVVEAVTGSADDDILAEPTPVAAPAVEAEPILTAAELAEAAPVAPVAHERFRVVVGADAVVASFPALADAVDDFYARKDAGERSRIHDAEKDEWYEDSENFDADPVPAEEAAVEVVEADDVVGVIIPDDAETAGLGDAVEVKPAKAKAADYTPGIDHAGLLGRWDAGEKIGALAKEVGMTHNRLHAELSRFANRPHFKPKAAK